MITVNDYLHARNADDLVRYVEDSVRQVLALGTESRPEGDDIESGWLARLPGHDPHTEDGRRWIPWDPSTSVPDHADQLACRARRRS
jgi:hypothetical protein